MTAPASAAPVIYHCSFPKVFDLGEGLHNQDFETTVAYDSTTATAAMIGNVGVSALQVYAGAHAVSFVEVVATGAVQTLTVLPSGAAVYSRHTFLTGNGDFIASQQYGTCAAQGDR